jgi:hypothetical protein
MTRYEIERSEPHVSRCDCCDGLTVRLTRFVYRDGDAFAVYYASYANNHPDNELAMLVSLGTWGKGSTASKRAAFYCRVRPTEDSYQVMLGDADQSVWRDARIVGARLSREDALRHPWKKTAFEVLDEAFVQDPSLRGFLHRVHCGDAAVPLEWSFAVPDEVFALGDQQKRRATIDRNFVILDRKRHFVRCLLPVGVEGYEPWNVGLWLEVSEIDARRVRDAWDDPVAYPALRFSGVLANDVQAHLELPLALGVGLHAHVPNPDAPPMIARPVMGAFTGILATPWPRDDFETYAIARGYL